MSECAIHKDQTRRPLEHILDDAATLGVGLAECLGDCCHARTHLHTRGKGGKRIASIECGNLEHVRLNRTVGSGLCFKPFPKHKVSKFCATDDA